MRLPVRWAIDRTSPALALVTSSLNGTKTSTQRNPASAASVHQKMLSIFKKGGYEVIIPKTTASTCCGMMFDTRGFNRVATDKRGELEAVLVQASENGKYPIVMDTSPCAQTVKANLTNNCLNFALYEPVEFISTFLTNKLEWTKVRDQVAVHVPCSSKQMGISPHFAKVRTSAGRGMPRVCWHSGGLRGGSANRT